MFEYRFKVKEEILNCLECPCSPEEFNTCEIDITVECSDIQIPPGCPLERRGEVIA